MSHIEFNYDTIDGQTLIVKAQIDCNKIYFKAWDGTKRATKGSLTTLDIRNIEEFVRENSEEDVETESDFYERQND